MSNIKVYLTKSREVASLIAHGYSDDLAKGINGITKVQFGCADDKEVVPAIYYKKCYFYCAVEYECIDYSVNYQYQLIIS